LIQGSTGIVTCVEQIGDAGLAATNLFPMQAGSWRMIHHHGSQIFAPRASSDGGGKTPVH